MKNYTDILIDDLYALSNEPMPQSVSLQAKMCVLDYLGTGLAGAAMVRERYAQYLDFFGSEPNEATVIGYARKASLHNAAFVNGCSAHITELDDGHRFCTVHLGTTIIPAVLAVAEHEHLSGEDLLRGIVIGYEAAIRLGRAVQPSHKNLGFHASGTAGTMGAAVGISAALKLSKLQMKHALSGAVAGAAGVLEVLEDESELKPFNIGRAALSGLTAAYMARAGFMGPNDIVGGKRGFFALMSDSFDESSLNREANGGYGIDNIYRKPYAACRHCHSPIEAAIILKEKHSFDNTQIKEINVRTYYAAFYKHDYTDIQGITSAKMSVPFSVAVALETGRGGLNEFMPRYIQDEAVMALTKKVRVFDDEELSALVPHKRAAIVEITMKSGENYSCRVDYPKGEPENPMSAGDIEQKFISLAMYGGKTEEEAKEIIKRAWDIDGGLNALFESL